MLLAMQWEVQMAYKTTFGSNPMGTQSNPNNSGKADRL